MRFSMALANILDADYGHCSVRPRHLARLLWAWKDWWTVGYGSGLFYSQSKQIDWCLVTLFLMLFIIILSDHQSQYASDALLITTLTLGKISTMRTIWDMAPRERRPYIIATEAVIGLWGVSSIVASFFQCSLPKPWDYIDGRCFNRVSWQDQRTCG